MIAGYLFLTFMLVLASNKMFNYPSYIYIPVCWGGELYKLLFASISIQMTSHFIVYLEMKQASKA